ncbi:MAG: hypothetical protein ACQERC_08450 [Bacteroidota bacterium]
MIILSVTGTIRMILIIIAVFVIVRFIGKLLMAKRSIDEDKRFHQNNDAFKKAKERSEKEKGKIDVVDRYRDAEDADYEEIADDDDKD